MFGKGVDDAVNGGHDEVVARYQGMKARPDSLHPLQIEGFAGLKHPSTRRRSTKDGRPKVLCQRIDGRLPRMSPRIAHAVGIFHRVVHVHDAARNGYLKEPFEWGGADVDARRAGAIIGELAGEEPKQSVVVE